MIKIICIIVFGLIISMMITYYIAVRTSKLKMMTDEDILQNIDKKLEIRSVYGVKAGSKTY